MTPILPMPAAAKVHAYIISHLKEQMPMVRPPSRPQEPPCSPSPRSLYPPQMMGFAKKQKQLIESLPAVFRTVMKKFNLAPGDFPDIRDFQDKLTEQVKRVHVFVVHVHCARARPRPCLVIPPRIDLV